MLSFLGIVLGIGLLIAGGTALVAGSSQVANRFGISPMIIGLTIVGFGTSAPELVVNLTGALTGQTELAFGNVVGSNISNLGLVLGCAALIRAIDIKGAVVHREIPLLLLITSVMTVMALDGLLDGEVDHISRTDGVVLLLLFLIFIYIMVRDVVSADADDALITEASQAPLLASSPYRLEWLLIPAGLALLYFGGRVTVESSVVFAELAGISPAIVGLFVVAIGTSMPELVTSIVAALRGESDLALGNIIGSNIFNSLVVLPVSAVATPVVIPDQGVFDLVVSWLFAAVLIPIFFLRNARIGRPSALFLLGSYIAYAVYRIT
jgi:cation:H+ antiporter